MRRIDDGHVQRPPPFRVLAAPDANYLSPLAAPPPPPRAPEPYKIAPSSTSFSRAHRRSSFVIIAESRPTTPESRSPSPTLAAGRVSPFRGRGFKGPPPRSKSRPESPELADGWKRSRNDRRVSVSQQNSPRRSLIPQPTRQRSTSLTKANNRSSSPKIGRRVDSRGRLNISDSRNRLNASNNSNSVTNLSSRRQGTKASTRLSPIQGTPTKPEKVVSQYGKKDRTYDGTKGSPTKTKRYSIQSPSKNITNVRKSNQEKNTNRERVTSPSKIPLKTNRNGTVSLNPARFITIPPDQPTDRAGKKNVRESKGIKKQEERPKDSGKNAVQSEGNSRESASGDKNSSSNEKSNELDLINLLKQTSGATGTSSVVSTTATTAVQPLHIDANAILAEKDGSEKRNHSDQVKNQLDASNVTSSNAVTSNDDSSTVRRLQNGHNINEDQRSSNAQVSSSRSNKSNSNYNRTKVTESRNDSPVPMENVSGHSKNNSVGQSVKNFNRTNGTSNGIGSATQRVTKIQGTTNDQNLKNSKIVEQRASDDHSSSMQTASTVNLSKSNGLDATNETNRSSSNVNTSGEKAPGSASIRTLETKVARTSNDTDVKMSSTTASTATTATAVATTTSNTITSQVTTNTKTNSVSVNAASGAVNNPQNVNSAGGRVRNDNRDSNVSLKSSTGVSTDSIESVRSTDTGVSVNTVRGVSSPREKTGMHVVKRPQEIETLSGNVMHLEQNGEPAVLEAANTVEERAPERFLARWKRSLSRYCKCCPTMRCLACRTDPKGFVWPRHHGSRVNSTRNQPDQQTTQTTEDTAGQTTPTGCWSKFKNGCRCNRIREMKCCSRRRSRIAPAEATVCCPPERRFGAICRRLFDSCKCKRAEAERTRSIRAKHSLTSVAPPPLSEEPKSKIPDVLVEHNSLMRGAIPCLPVPLAWFCLVWNILLPGSGTVWSGIFNLCTGQPRFSSVASLKSRLGAFVVNLIVGVGQLFTVLFCLVGWGWSIWWGVTLIRLARKYKRFKASEAASNDPEARGGDPGALPPGVPSQALRGMERSR